MVRPRRQLPTKLHLPDCNSLAFARADTASAQACDCGTPPGILPDSKTIVRRFSPKRNRVALVVIPKSQVLHGEEDLAESGLLFEAESNAWIREQQRALDRLERKSQSKASGPNVWAYS